MDQWIGNIFCGFRGIPPGDCGYISSDNAFMVVDTQLIVYLSGVICWDYWQI